MLEGPECGIQVIPLVCSGRLRTLHACGAYFPPSLNICSAVWEGSISSGALVSVTGTPVGWDTLWCLAVFDGELVGQEWDLSPAEGVSFPLAPSQG